MRLHYVIHTVSMNGFVDSMSRYRSQLDSWIVCVPSLGNSECIYREDTMETTVIVNQILTEQKVRRKSDRNCLQQCCDAMELHDRLREISFI